MPGSRGLTESTNFFPSPRICHEDEIQEEGAEGEGGGKGNEDTWGDSIGRRGSRKTRRAIKHAQYNIISAGL